jgi:hypothetical protein
MLPYSTVDSEEKESKSTTYLKKKLMKMDDKEKTTPTITMRKR